MIGYHVIRHNNDLDSVLKSGIHKPGHGYISREPAVYFFTNLDEFKQVAAHHHSYEDGHIVAFEVPETILIHTDYEANGDWGMETAKYILHDVMPEQITDVYNFAFTGNGPQLIWD